MKICSILGCSLLAVSMTACVSAGPALWQAPLAANANRLPPLEAVAEMGPLYNTDATQPEELEELLRSELHNNLAEAPAPDHFGYAHLRVTQATLRRTGRVLQAVQLATFLIPSLVGIPIETYRTALTARLEITDAQGTVLGEYEGHGASAVRVAMYYGYSQSTAPALADATALRQALAQIRPQVDTAAGRLRPRLLAAGVTEQPDPARPSSQPPVARSRPNRGR